MNNLRLARLTGDSGLEEVARNIARAFSREIGEAPQAYTQMLCALDFMAGPSLEIVIAGDLQDSGTQRMLARLYSSFVPNKVVLLHPDGEAAQAIEELAPFTREQQRVAGKATAYVCRNFACQAPVTDPEKIMELIP
jgi:uncharacterized protein